MWLCMSKTFKAIVIYNDYFELKSICDNNIEKLEYFKKDY